MKLMVICCISAMISGFPAYGAVRTTDRSHEIRLRVQYGVASWYGDREQGRLMASGEPFNEYAMVAAHRILPLGTSVRVTNLQNGRSVVVRIMDRGPRMAGRVIDLSKAAAERLRFTHQGLAPVRIRVLNEPVRQRREAELKRRPERMHREMARWADNGPVLQAAGHQSAAFTQQ
jgi:rare lipoprotein A